MALAASFSKKQILTVFLCIHFPLKISWSSDLLYDVSSLVDLRKKSMIFSLLSISLLLCG